MFGEEKEGIVANILQEPEEMRLKKVVSITEAARINGVTRQAIYVAIKQGKLKDWSYSIISNDYIYNNFKFLSKEKTLKFWSDFIKGKVNSGYPIWQLLNMYYILKFEKEFKR